MAADGRGHLFFDGVYRGLYRTDLHLHEQAGTPDVIDPATFAREGYNHIGDIAYSRREGGRIILPLECYNPGATPSNTCGTGSFGVADPTTLAWRYSVKLDPRDIPKAMWVRDLPGRQARLDADRERPDRLPRQRRHAGARLAGGAADPPRAPAEGRRAAGRASPARSSTTGACSWPAATSRT